MDARRICMTDRCVESRLELIRTGPRDRRPRSSPAQSSRGGGGRHPNNRPEGGWKGGANSTYRSLAWAGPPKFDVTGMTLPADGWSSLLRAHWRRRSLLSPPLPQASLLTKLLLPGTCLVYFLDLPLDRLLLSFSGVSLTSSLWNLV